MYKDIFEWLEYTLYEYVANVSPTHTLHHTIIYTYLTFLYTFIVYLILDVFTVFTVFNANTVFTVFNIFNANTVFNVFNANTVFNANNAFNDNPSLIFVNYLLYHWWHYMYRDCCWIMCVVFQISRKTSCTTK